MTDERQSVTINGRQYFFKRAKLGIVKRAQQHYIEKFSKHDVFSPEVDIDSPEWQEAEKDWKVFCDMVFEEVDDGLKLVELTEKEFLSIIEVFFVSRVAALLASVATLPSLDATSKVAKEETSRQKDTPSTS